jgi:integrase
MRVRAIGLCFGLRIFEFLGLQWTDFDFKRSVVLIQRSAVGKRLNKLKTEYSEDEVPIERGFILELRKWQSICLDSKERWLFPSHVSFKRAKLMGGKVVQDGMSKASPQNRVSSRFNIHDETNTPINCRSHLALHLNFLPRKAACCTT